MPNRFLFDLSLVVLLSKKALWVPFIALTILLVNGLDSYAQTSIAIRMVSGEPNYYWNTRDACAGKVILALNGSDYQDRIASEEQRFFIEQVRSTDSLSYDDRVRIRTCSNSYLRATEDKEVEFVKESLCGKWCEFIIRQPPNAKYTSGQPVELVAFEATGFGSDKAYFITGNPNFDLKVVIGSDTVQNPLNTFKLIRNPRTPAQVAAPPAPTPGIDLTNYKTMCSGKGNIPNGWIVYQLDKSSECGSKEYNYRYSIRNISILPVNSIVTLCQPTQGKIPAGWKSTSETPRDAVCGKGGREVTIKRVT